MIQIQNLSKTYSLKDNTVEALKNINLTIDDGDIFGIIGMSGAGKSTLVRCINYLEKPSSGKVLIDNKDLSTMTNKELRDLRRNVTMIFQGFNLLMQRTCLKNICFPLELIGIDKSQAVKKAKELLEIVGLPDKANSYPSQLSGGQQQRVAIARALATNPKVLLCDEATSALDPKTTGDILKLIKEINVKTGITVIVITHQMSVVEEICNHVAILDNGTIAEVGKVSDIFSNPQTLPAKKLVFPDSAEDIIVPNPNEKRIRLVFNGAKITSTPLIANMAKDIDICANIITASTKSVDGKAYGNMLLSIPENDDALAKLKEYFSHINDITIDEV